MVIGSRKIAYPENPRSSNNPRTPFGPSSGSGIFLQILIIIGEPKLRGKRGAHVSKRADICYGLVTAISVYTHNDTLEDSPF
jgi:hypothetical protein